VFDTKSATLTYHSKAVTTLRFRLGACAHMGGGVRGLQLLLRLPSLPGVGRKLEMSHWSKEFVDNIRPEVEEVCDGLEVAGMEYPALRRYGMEQFWLGDRFPVPDPGIHMLYWCWEVTLLPADENCGQLSVMFNIGAMSRENPAEKI